MAIFYMAFGFFIAFTNVLKENIRENRMIIGCILMGYGLFRFIKITMDLRRMYREEKGFFEDAN